MLVCSWQRPLSLGGQPGWSPVDTGGVGSLCLHLQYTFKVKPVRVEYSVTFTRRAGDALNKRPLGKPSWDITVCPPSMVTVSSFPPPSPSSPSADRPGFDRPLLRPLLLPQFANSMVSFEQTTLKLHPRILRIPEHWSGYFHMHIRITCVVSRHSDLWSTALPSLVNWSCNTDPSKTAFNMPLAVPISCQSHVPTSILAVTTDPTSCEPCPFSRPRRSRYRMPTMIAV